MFQDFIVEESWRNQGVGSTILAYARNRARIKQCVRIDLVVHSSLSQAKQFIERWGFRRMDRDLYRILLARPNAGIS
jgi:GNAT superfamily N-acetyltransferase